MIGAGPLVSMRDVTKQFPGVVALDHVNFELVSGEIHALLGENGAGKSTLIKIISGVYPPTSGEVYIRGTLMHSFTPSSARGLGVGTVYQGLSLVPSLTVTQNLFLGHEQASHPMGWLDRPRMRVRAREALHDIGLDVDPDLNVERLSISQQQLVEIAKVLLLGVEILIMDEPTDKLTAREAGRLFALLRTMRQAGRGVIYITHKLEEIMQIADRVTVLRDGHKVATVPAGQTSFPHLIQMMVGRDIREVFPKKIVPLGGELLGVKHLSVPGILEDVSLSVRAGEIVGMAGLVGSGRTELAKAIVGALPMSQGELQLFGRPVRISSPNVAVRSGLALLPEDRHKEGLFLLLSVRENIMLPSLRRMWLNFRQMENVARQFVERLRIRTPSLQTPALQLSGGNQQKVVLSKWLTTRARVFIFDEPMQGIDVGSKVEICRLIGELAEAGAGIILISSELREILALADRVVVMRKGRIVANLARDQATQEIVLGAIFGESAA